jgi:hypothetical protein
MRITDADLDRPQEPPPSAFPPGLGLGDDDEGPQDAFAMPVRESGGRPPWVYVAIGAAALVLIVVLAIVFFGGDDDGTTPPTGVGGQVSADEAMTAMCARVQQLQVVRDDALAEAADQLQADAAALKEAGERQAAKQVRAVIAAIGDVRDALANQQDTTEQYEALDAAIQDLPC